MLIWRKCPIGPRCFARVVRDKEKLESITGKRVDYFAYPFGAWRNPSTDLIEILKEAGIQGSRHDCSGLQHWETNPHLLHRELTGTPTPICVFKARTLGTYDGVRFLKRRAKSFSRWLSRRRRDLPVGGIGTLEQSATCRQPTVLLRRSPTLIDVI